MLMIIEDILGDVFMNMKIIKSRRELCLCCMEEHEVKTVLVDEQATFKNVKVNYEASYLFCDKAKELFMNEEQIQANYTKMKESYRERLTQD